MDNTNAEGAVRGRLSFLCALSLWEKSTIIEKNGQRRGCYEPGQTVHFMDECRSAHSKTDGDDVRKKFPKKRLVEGGHCDRLGRCGEAFGGKVNEEIISLCI